MSPIQRFTKRGIDIVGSLIGLIVSFPVIVIAAALAQREFGKSGIFQQERVGLNGRLFMIYKIRTMRDLPGHTTSVTTVRDPRLTPLGRWLRHCKIDELPQFFNVLIGDMSLVGPRPDVTEIMCDLNDEDRVILSVRPGLTGPAAVSYPDEERLLANVADPDRFNREVLFPRKVTLNRKYIAEYRLWHDFIYIWKTVFGNGDHVELRSISDLSADSRYRIADEFHLDEYEEHKIAVCVAMADTTSDESCKP